MKRLFIYLAFFIALFSACTQEDGNELTLAEVQKAAIAEQNRFKLRATVDVFDFNTNSVSVASQPDSTIQLFAKNGSREMVLRFPKIEVGSYAATDVFISFLDSDQRFYTSTTDRFDSDARIVISEVDSARNIFSGTFTGTLYDNSKPNPADRGSQASINGGKLVNVSF